MLFKLMRVAQKDTNQYPFSKLGNAYYFNAQLEQVENGMANYLFN
jgi:hypothetical protein